MRKKLLFVCTANKLRSKTAEDIFKQDLRFEVKSAGTDILAKTQIYKVLLEWADYIFVMGKIHKKIINKQYPKIYNNKRIVCLDIKLEDLMFLRGIIQ